MATALDLITQALLKLGVYAPGETVSAADSAQGLTVLNDMLDSWSNESLTTYQILEQSGVMQVGVSSYTVGSGGVFNVTRPLRILDGPGAAYLQDSQGNNYAVDVVPLDKWNLIGNRTVTSNVPDTLFYDPAYPLGIIKVFPVPTMAWTLFWDSYLQLADFSALTTALSLPPGYKKAMQDCLAVELWPYFKKGNPDELLLELASKSKGNVRRTNLRPVEAVYDSELVAHGVGTYNVYSDRGG